MFHISKHWENANQNYSEMLLHTVSMAIIKNLKNEPWQHSETLSLQKMKKKCNTNIIILTYQLNVLIEPKKKTKK